MNNTPTTEERIWAILAHLSALAFGMGIVLPVIGWSDQRRKSNYAAFQSLQALGYQSLGFTVWILSYLVIIIVAAIILFFLTGSGDGSSERLSTVLRPAIIIILSLVFGFFALYVLLPIVAAVACALGKDFRYPILGDRLARYLGYDPAQASEEQTSLHEDHEFRWMAAMGHFSILIIIWGMLAPLTAWVLYGKRSDFLKFQSIQTLVYQAGATVLFFAGLVLYLFSLLFFILGTGALENPDLNSSIGIAGLVLLGALLLISILVLLLVPAMHILGQWAGYRVLKGDDYRYPLIGPLVEKSLRSRLGSKGS